MRIDLKSIEPNLKIACHGPALSGNTANLGNIHTSVDPRLPGELVSLDSQEDRTLFVDSLHLEAGLIRGLDPKSSLCVVPGLVIDGAAGQFVLAGTMRSRRATGRVCLSFCVWCSGFFVSSGAACGIWLRRGPKAQASSIL